MYLQTKWCIKFTVFFFFHNKNEKKGLQIVCLFIDPTRESTECATLFVQTEIEPTRLDTIKIETNHLKLKGTHTMEKN